MAVMSTGSGVVAWEGSAGRGTAVTVQTTSTLKSGSSPLRLR